MIVMFTGFGHAAGGASCAFGSLFSIACLTLPFATDVQPDRARIKATQRAAVRIDTFSFVKMALQDGQNALVLVHFSQLVLDLLEVPRVACNEDGVVHHDVHLCLEHVEVALAVFLDGVQARLTLRARHV
jgi:hypothetical protein